MIICTADFDWISILFLIIAGAISIIKGAKNKKTAQRPVSPQPEYNEKEIEKEYTEPKYKGFFESYSSEIIPQTDYYKEKAAKPVKEVKDKPTFQFSEEEEKEENIHFDIRQAVISSEILRRPQY